MNRDSLMIFVTTPLRVAALCTMAVFPIAAQSTDTALNKPPTYSVLYTFAGESDGAIPNNFGGSLVRDVQGNLYGTASAEGEVNAYCSVGCGVVFKIDRSGKQTVLHTFGGPPDGANPYTPLTLADDGTLYGTTLGGGNAALGAGTVFKIDRQGKETVLYNFTGGADGNTPYGGVIIGRDGSLYGTTFAGGTANAGLIYQIDCAGREKVLYNFSGGADGAEPQYLLQHPDGTLYGATFAGGAANAGVIFQLDRSEHEKVIYSFTGAADGGEPGNLIWDSSSDRFFGVAYTGGSFTGNCGAFFGGCGVVFSLTPQGKERVLYTFQGTTDGSTPYGRLWQEGQQLYGTAFFGGDPNGCAPVGCGVIYKLGLNGKETILYSFTGLADGANPYAGIIRGNDGAFYGSTGYGGNLAAALDVCYGSGCGVVFKLDPGDERDMRDATTLSLTDAKAGAIYMNSPPLAQPSPNIWTIWK